MPTRNYRTYKSKKRITLKKICCLTLAIFLTGQSFFLFGEAAVIKRVEKNDKSENLDFNTLSNQNVANGLMKHIVFDVPVRALELAKSEPDRFAAIKQSTNVSCPIEK